MKAYPVIPPSSLSGLMVIARPGRIIRLMPGTMPDVPHDLTARFLILSLAVTACLLTAWAKGMFG